jgi:peptide/nickel transport system permease protein
VTNFVLRRLVQLPIVLLAVLTGLFVLLRLSGDPVALLLPDGATAAQITALRTSLGLNRSIGVQYIVFLRNIVTRFDFGTSITYGRPALDVVLERLPNTLLLTFAAALLAVVLGFAAGIFAVTRTGRRFSFLIEILALIGQSMPTYWLGILLVWLFSLELHLLPTAGAGGLSHLIMPAFALGAPMMAKTIRLTEAGLGDAMTDDYIRTAHAKGLSFRQILFNHAVKNAVMPVISVIGLDIGQLLGGAILVETIFSWPGLGLLMVQAVLARDYPIVEAIVFLMAIFVSVIMLAVDICYRWLEPRLR